VQEGEMEVLVFFLSMVAMSIMMLLMEQMMCRGRKWATVFPGSKH
jgi:hypothetical protein